MRRPGASGPYVAVAEMSATVPTDEHVERVVRERADAQKALYRVGDLVRVRTFRGEESRAYILEVGRCFVCVTYSVAYLTPRGVSPSSGVKICADRVLGRVAMPKGRKAAVKSC